MVGCKNEKFVAPCDCFLKLVAKSTTRFITKTKREKLKKFASSCFSVVKIVMNAIFEVRVFRKKTFTLYLHIFALGKQLSLENNQISNFHI